MINKNIDTQYSFKKTVRFVFFISLAFLLILVGKLFVLQILESKKYATLSDKNRIRVYPIVQRRGRIITSDGKVVAQNRQRYRLSIESCDIETFTKNFDLIASKINITDAEKTELFESRKNKPKYTPILLKDELSWDEYSKIAMIFYKLNHVSIENSFIREYLMPIEFCHVIGYTTKNKNYLQSLTGQTGIEAFADDQLVGIPGNVKIEINSVGKKMRVIDSVSPVDGEDIIITINSEIQKFIYNLLSAEKAGACVVLDITNGNVVALVSVPGFNSNPITSKISQNEWNKLLNNPLKPLINRAIGGIYPPGSVFKIVTILAALEKKVISPKDTIYCSGGVVLDGNTFHCWKRSGHGKINAYDALRFSCDCYIFEVAKKLGINAIVEYAQKLGYGSKTGIEIPNESSGLLPSKQWKLLRYGKSWKPYETIITAIGQGALLATLIQSATMMGKIYTNNYNFRPSLLIRSQRRFNDERVDPIGTANVEVIKSALYQVCNAGGTASRSCKTAYGISGKTGSSQVRKIRKGEAGMSQNAFPWHFRDHAFFVGCAPYEHPRYVVAVMVEHGGSGSATAAPIARQVFDKLMSMQDVRNTANTKNFHDNFNSVEKR
ncbi:MAG: penicillin-binding protein 2 [Alphaproteobacteria bacterium]|nr:penicillin-binding protein 2 [Alphaproteobacteria bacterium]